MALHVTLTGRVTLRDDVHVVREGDLPGRLGRMVLARLALAQHPIGRFDLFDDLWTEGPPPAAESVLNATFSRLRNALTALGVDGKETLVAASGVVELRLPVDARIDVHCAHRAIDSAQAAFRRGDHGRAWSEAVVAQAIARRPFLAGIERFWIDTERHRLRHVHERALCTLIDVWTAAGDIQQSVTLCRELVSIHPFSEESHRRLVSALLAHGDRSAAADAVGQWERIIEEELGLRADDGLRRLLTSASRG